MDSVCNKAPWIQGVADQPAASTWDQRLVVSSPGVSPRPLPLSFRTGPSKSRGKSTCVEAEQGLLGRDADRVS